MSQPPPLEQDPVSTPAQLPVVSTLPFAVQILLGVLAVGGGLIVLLIASMILLTALRIDSVYVMIAILCIGSLAAGLPLAWWLQSNPAYRGYAIGIYAGLVLHLLVQAAFTLLVLALAKNQK